MDFFIQLFTDPVGFYQAHQLLVGDIGISALLAISIFITLYSGQLSLAQVGFMAIGGYTSVLMGLHLGTPLALNAMAGALLAAVASVAVGLPALRLRGIFLALATLGFGEALRFAVILNLPITGEGQGLINIHADPVGGILPIWISVVALAYVFWRISGSKLGQAWAAIREDELAAASGGIAVARHKLVAFVVGAAIAAYAGALDANLSFDVDPSHYTASRAIQALTFAVVGGSSNVLGPIVGAIFLDSLPEIVRFLRDYRDIVNGIILILVIVFRPQGIVGRGGLALIRPRWLPKRPQDGSPAPA